jgi:hypothetical protein
MWESQTNSNKMLTVWCTYRVPAKLIRNQRCERCARRILYFLRLLSVNSCPKTTHLFWYFFGGKNLHVYPHASNAKLSLSHRFVFVWKICWTPAGDFGDGQFYLSHSWPCGLIGHPVVPWPLRRDATDCLGGSWTSDARCYRLPRR